MPTKSRSCLVLWNKSRGLLAYYSRESRVRVFGFFYTHTHVGVLVHQQCGEEAHSLRLGITHPSARPTVGRPPREQGKKRRGQAELDY
jgi:hypothetical protein